MDGAIYLALLPILNYFFGDRNNQLNIFIVCVLFATDIYITKLFSMAENDLLFFSSKAIFDLILIATVYIINVCTFKRLVLYLCCILSFLVNVYLCYEKGNVWVYQHWETINLVLCEVMILTLFLKDFSLKQLRTLQMIK